MDITATDFLKTSTNTAEHFGFVNLQTLKKHPQYKACKHKFDHSATANDRKMDSLHGLLTGGINIFGDIRGHGFEEPILYYGIEQVPRSGEVALSLHVFGVEKSIAEAILIQASRAIAADLGYENTSVRINSLGDNDSSVRYTRELTNYLKKRMDEMPESARELMKEHVMTALQHLIEKEHDLAYKSPSPLEYLSDPSRKHFREIVEFLDLSQTAYEIDPKLIGHHECYSDALFALDLLDEEDHKMEHEPLLIRGGRYSTFMDRHAKQSESISATGAVIVLRDKKAPQRTPRSTRNQNPDMYVVQLGFGPKVRSLMLIDKLRRNGITVHQNLASDSLSSQLRHAEEIGVRHVVIIGQKEFVEDTVILRDMTARNQENVSLDSLVGRLRRLQGVRA